MKHLIEVAAFTGLCLSAFAVPSLADSTKPLNPNAPASVSSPITLEQAIGIALQAQPQGLSADATVSSAKGQVEQAQSQYYPQVAAQYNYNNTSVNVWGQKTATINGVGVQPVNATRGGGTTVTLNVPIFDNGTREADNAQARHTLDAAKSGDIDARAQVVLNVTNDYFAVLAALDQVTVAQAQVTRYQQVADLTNAEIAAGTAAKNSVFQPEADLANSRITLAQAQGSVSTAMATLKSAMGVEIDGPLNLTPLPQTNGLPTTPTFADHTTLQQDMETALSDRADLAASEFTLKAAADSLKAAELASGITVDGTYALDYQITNDIGTRGSDSTVGLSASYPIFDGGERRGAVRVAKAARDQAFDTMLQTRLTVRTGVETAYAQRDQAATSVALGRAAVDAAQASYDSAVAGLKAGVNTEVDVSTAQAALTQAEFSYVGAIYTYFEADAALQRAMGALPTTTVHNSPFAK